MPIANSIHGVSVHSELHCQSSWAFALSHSSTSLLNLLRSQLARVNLRPFTMPVLGNHISSVVCGGSKEQVRRVNAVTNIALVENTKALRNGAEVNDPRESVSRVPFYRGPVGVVQKMAITVRLNDTCPQPAGVSLFDVSPKTLNQRHSLSLAQKLVAALQRAALLLRSYGVELLSAEGTLELRHSKPSLSMFQGLAGVLASVSRLLNLQPKPQIG